ncbi:hypothetical protein FBEOM_2071 [Fusarium beomiforme]|uniref:Uncharacterized protein n=1 Tax=Fusarium beomiforme TaxID=44412 RepID=A0A9P5E351_9HYPO|nr:hypothetical protein FBEOM_2071 [Fusarium beomiforme]
MKWATPEDNTRLRARQIRRYHDKHENCGSLPHAEKITKEDLAFAIELAPVWRLKDCEEGELEYPPQWETLPRSLIYTLRSFRRNAPNINDKGPDWSTMLGDVEAERLVVAAFKSQLEVTKGELKKTTEALKKAEKMRDYYLARAEKAEDELEKLEAERKI